MFKPVILIGNGCRHNPELVEYLCSLGVPVMTTWMAADLIEEEHPAFCGRPGIFGQRAANLIQQSAKVLWCYGARLDGEQVAYRYEAFAPNAHKIVYDCDPAELEKLPGDWERECVDLSEPGPGVDTPEFPDIRWMDYCKNLYHRFRPELDGTNSGTKFIDPFAFINALSDACMSDDMLAIGSSGGAPTSFLQAFKVKRGQMIRNCSTLGPMGADIPSAIGACIASGRRTICVTGDGGFMLNTQELEVVRRLNLPITFFVYSNGGYGSIRTMQDSRFNGRRVGADADSGLTLPPLEGIAQAYGLIYRKVNRPEQVHIYNGGAIVEVSVDPEWRQLPRVMASTVNGQLVTDDMSDMTPKLPADELQAILEFGNEPDI